MRHVEASLPACFCCSSQGKQWFFWGFSHVQNIYSSKLTVKTERLMGRTPGELCYRLSLPPYTHPTQTHAWPTLCISSSICTKKVPSLCTSLAHLENNIIEKCCVKSRHKTTTRKMCKRCYHCFPEIYVCFIQKFRKKAMLTINMKTNFKKTWHD